MSRGLEAEIRARAAGLGFPLCGFAPVQRPPHADAVAAWLAAGHAGEMAYIERGLLKRLDPQAVLPGARSIVSVAFPYRAPATPPIDWPAELRGRIAAYTAGPDYHGTVLAKLDALADAIRALAPEARTLTYVDTGPVLEREWAAIGGVGWFGKNTMILHPQRGSWFFLGDIICTLPLEPDAPIADQCGGCRRCIDVCPTGALSDGYRLDARVCISYLTIEHRGPIPRELRPKMGNWIFGCDECQEVCPWNGGGDRDFSELTPHLPDLLALDEQGFRARFKGSAVRRAKRAGLLRNAAIALGNSHNPAAVSALGAAVAGDPSPLVRAHAAWALGEIDGSEARRALEGARCDDDPAVREEAKSALDAAA